MTTFTARNHRGIAADTDAVSLNPSGPGRRDAPVVVPVATTGPVSDTTRRGGELRLFQVTTPTQPGSGGGPSSDCHDHLVGVVTALRTAGQTVNFTVPGTLADALVEASGHHPLRSPAPAPMDLAEILRVAQGVVCRLECRR